MLLRHTIKAATEAFTLLKLFCLEHTHCVLARHEQPEVWCRCLHVTYITPVAVSVLQ